MEENNSPINPSIDTKKRFSKLWAYGLLVVLALLLTTVGYLFGSSKSTPTKGQQSTSETLQPTYDATKDAVVKNFKNYQSFGGKYAIAQKSVTYTVFLPDAFGYDIKKDRLQLSYRSGAQGDVLAAESNNADACKKADGGITCDLKWEFKEQELAQAETFVSFKVLGNDTKQKGRVFVPITEGVYAEGGSSVIVNKPLTVPYAELVNSGTLELFDKAKVGDIPIKVQMNAGYKTGRAELYVDDKKINQTDTFAISDEANYQGGKVAVYELSLGKDELLQLSQGMHKISVVVKGADYEAWGTSLNGQDYLDLVVYFK